MNASPENSVDSAPSADTVQPASDKLPARVANWCSKLLDLSRRNHLLNFKEGPSAARILCQDPAAIEDELADLSVFSILELPKDASGRSIVPNDETLAKETKARKLFLQPGSANSYNRMLGLFRATRTDIEEGGTNTLYLSLGVLKWKDGTGENAPVYRAPLLLYPVRLEKLPAKTGFRMGRSDEDPVSNVTLLEMLRREKNLEVKGVEPPPADEHGVDVAAVFEAYRAAVAPLEGWEILPEVWIGRFSFNKFLMWKDLNARLGELEKSPIVSHLIRRAGLFDDGVEPVDPAQVDPLCDESFPLCPMTADSSQMAAVLSTLRGKNFVLHGPPGTGKSQTITNLISACLSEGKTVLFVAEKRAALEVVQRRLRKVGLGPFCLELHSNKSGKGDVLRQFGEVLSFAAAQEPAVWEDALAKLRGTRSGLDGYVRALHRKHPCGLTPYEAFSYLLAHGAGCAEDSILPDAPLGEGAYGQSLSRAQAIAGTAREIPAGRFAPFAYVRTTEWTPDWSSRLVAAARPVAEAADAFAEAARPFEAATGLDATALSGPALAAAHAVAALVPDAPVLPAGLFGADWEDFSPAFRAWVEAGAANAALRAEQPEFDFEKVLEVDVDSYRRRFAQNRECFCLTRWNRNRALRRDVFSLLKPGELKKIRLSELPRYFDLFAAYQKNTETLDAGFSGSERLGADCKGADSDWKKLPAWLAACDALWAAAEPFGAERPAAISKLGIVLASAAANRPLAASSVRAFAAADESLVAALRPLRELAWTQPAFDASPAAWRSAAGATIDETGLLRAWCRFQTACREAENNGLAPLVEAVCAERIVADGVENAFRTAYALRFVKNVIDGDDTLRSFFGSGQDSLVSRFARIDRDVGDFCRDMAVAKLSARLPSARLGDCPASSELGFLRHEVAKKARQKPVRQLLEGIPNLLPVLKPCLLMSPLSVAQYLPPGGKIFDVVVFDEASQLTVWDAVGVLARGRQAVVVGDPMQLPPTNFFQKAAPGGEEEATPDEDDVEDLDSILDECKAAGVSELALRWHYRSRHESLIAFSNRHYYEGGLYTFPSSAAACKGLGVRRVKVDGVYDRSRTRTNRAEAEAVVAAAVERLLDPAFKDKTTGIVTFSMAQQALIEDLLDEEQTKHPEIMPFFDDSLPEPFFVKNLENVQGDERDAIYFSVGYAPDEKGYFAMNFGPLNRPGGERRLNVAVTRAREEVVLFTSIDAVQIDLGRTSAAGAAHLRDFLAYAEAGGAVEAPSASKLSGPGFESAVAEFLRGHGFEVDFRIGESGYKIDLAVRARDPKDGYVLGIECDGAMYRDAATARDRDESRRSVLEGLGWRMTRCWALEWWFDGEKARAKLLAEARAAVEGTPPPAGPKPEKIRYEARKEPPVSKPSVAVSAAGNGTGGGEPATSTAADNPWRREYKLAEPPRTPFVQANFNETVGARYIAPQILRILQAEGPMVESLLQKRILAEWGFKSVGDKKKAILREAYPTECAVTKRGTEKVFWPAGVDPSAWRSYRVPGADPATKRDFDEIPYEELAVAMAAAARSFGGFSTIDPSVLDLETAKVLGFARVAPSMKEAFDAARPLAQKLTV